MSVMLVGGGVALVRVVILWYVTYRQWSGNESLFELPLIILLFPELLVMPNNRPTAANMWVSTGILVVGSFAVVSALALLVWIYVAWGTMRQSGRNR